jgi:hypothetical protein
MKIPNPEIVRLVTFISGKYYVTYGSDSYYYAHHEDDDPEAYGPFTEEIQALKYLIRTLVYKEHKCNNN